MSRSRTLAFVVFLAPAMAICSDKFEVAAEKTIPEIPLGGSGWGTLSPDGRSVLTTELGRLAVRPLESMEERELLPQGFIKTVWTRPWAVLSADNKSAYYLHSADPPVTLDLWRLDLSTRKTHLVIRNAAAANTPKPQLSPDGKSLAFCRGKTILLADANGGNERVACERCDAGRLTWSPDSSQIMFVAFSNSTSNLNLLTTATGQVNALGPWRGGGTTVSIVWPSWSSGPFLSVIEPAPNGEIRTMQIWHLRLPQGERTQVTRDLTSRYFYIFGTGAEGHSLVIDLQQPPRVGWDLFFDLVTGFIPGHNGPSPDRDPNFKPTILLTLKD